MPALDPRPFLWAALLFAGCTAPAPMAPSPAIDLECRLEPRPPLVAGGPVGLGFALANRSAGPVWVLRWNTPLEGWKGTLFRVTREGEEVAYQGPMMKRGDPAREDYAEIPAGGRVEGAVDLAQAYDLSRPGRYQAEVVGGLLDATTDGASVPRPRDHHQSVPLACAPAVLEVASAR